MSVSDQFAKYVIEEIFTDDKRGDYVCPIVDDAFMERAASRLGVSQNKIIESVILNGRYGCRNTNTILSTIMIQIYAAHKRTDKAYLVQLDNLLHNIPCYVADYSKIWMEEHQDTLWKGFYLWCNKNGFKIQKRRERPGPYRYVQYPTELAKYTFNQSDLDCFGYIFNQYGLKPSDSIAFVDFWNNGLLSVSEFEGLNHHTQDVVNNIYNDLHSYDLAKSQIYSYFNLWNGKFTIPYRYNNRNKVNEANCFDIHLSTLQSNFEICIENVQNNDLQSISIDRNLKSTLSKFYRYRKNRNNIILFQKNQDYDDYWNETMFVRSKDETALIVTTGIVYELFTRHFNVIYSQGDIRIYEISYKDYTRQFYTQATPVYELFGGLKISKNTYLKGGAPILRILKDGGFWMDGVHYDGEAGDRVLDFNIGEHWIKFPDKNKESITVVDQDMKLRDWDVGYSQWVIDKKEQRWQPISHINGIIGIDFKTYSQLEIKRASLKDWIMTQNGAKINSNNISVKLSKNYE